MFESPYLILGATGLALVPGNRRTAGRLPMGIQVEIDSVFKLRV
ncbi:hypothetical protein [Pseudomonas gingeri]|nr:hypothetical protein [Pseudomonas gingeri]